MACTDWCIFAVCTRCVADPALMKLLTTNLTEVECDLCGRKEEQPIACDVEVLIAYVRRRIEREFYHPEDVTRPEEEVEQYQPERFDTAGILDEIGLNDVAGGIRFRITCSLGEHEWCRKQSQLSANTTICPSVQG